jgi:hypothetical protein
VCGFVNATAVVASVEDGWGLWRWRARYSLRCGVFSRRASSQRERPSRRGKSVSHAVSRLAVDAGGGSPWSCRACSASRRVDGVASSGLPAVVERRIKHRVTGAQARTERSSLETPVSTPTEAASPSKRGGATRQPSPEPPEARGRAKPAPRSCAMTSRTKHHSEGENPKGKTHCSPCALQRRRQEALERY